MSLRDNYIIKSVTSRPVVSILIAVLASLLTYMITSDTIEKRDREITRLTLEIKSLSQQSEEYEETYDPKTGKLTKKKIKKESKKENSSNKESYVEKESTSIPSKKNKIYIGYGYDIDTKLLPVYYIGYSRQVWFMDLGVLLNMNQDFGNFGVAGTVGISF